MRAISVSIQEAGMSPYEEMNDGKDTPKEYGCGDLLIPSPVHSNNSGGAVQQSMYVHHNEDNESVGSSSKL